MMAGGWRGVRGAASVIVVAGMVLAIPAIAEEFEGLPEGPGREETYYGCVACHSMAIIKQQRLSGRVWDEVLTWMVDEKGMPEPEPKQRAIILEYLTKHFGEDVPR